MHAPYVTTRRLRIIRIYIYIDLFLSAFILHTRMYFVMRMGKNVIISGENSATFRLSDILKLHKVKGNDGLKNT